MSSNPHAFSNSAVLAALACNGVSPTALDGLRTGGSLSLNLQDLTGLWAQALSSAQVWQPVQPADLPSLAGRVVLTPDGTYDVAHGGTQEGVLCSSGRRFAVRDLSLAAAAHEPTETPDAHRMAQVLRQRGYAVTLFSPEELNGVEADRVESRLAEEGNEIISILQDAPTAVAFAGPRA